jgi:hypothetical protein
VNQNDIEILPHFSQWLSSRTQTTTKAGEDGVRGGTLVHCLWKCKLAQPLWKLVWRLLKKLKMDLP